MHACNYKAVPQSNGEGGGLKSGSHGGGGPLPDRQRWRTAWEERRRSKAGTKHRRRWYLLESWTSLLGSEAPARFHLCYIYNIRPATCSTAPAGPAGPGAAASSDGVTDHTSERDGSARNATRMFIRPIRRCRVTFPPFVWRFQAAVIGRRCQTRPSSQTM